MVLAPTLDLVREANRTGDYNDCSYVLLLVEPGFKAIFAGDSHDKTWKHILGKYKHVVSDVDLLIAPHHGRASGRSFEFLSTVRPKMTFFGNAPSENLAYDQWNRPGWRKMTNNEANCVIVDTTHPNLPVYVTNERFARRNHLFTEPSYSPLHCAWEWGFIR